MTQPATTHDALTHVAELIKTGDLRTAKQHMSRLLDHADTHALALIGRCASTLQNYPHPIALEKLRNAWKRTTDPEHRALIAACAPTEDTGQYRPTETTTEPRYGPHNYQAPRNSRRWIDPNRRTTHKPRKHEEPRTVTEYMDTRAGVDDLPPRAERPDGYALDYDNAAVPDVRGMPCVFCWLERSAADATTDRVRAGHGDDGLCTECREADRPGIPALPAEHTRAQAIEARCAHIAERAGANAQGILRHEWKRATPRDRHTITAWVQANPIPPTITQDNTTETTARPRAADRMTCEQCGDTRHVRHGLCSECRTLERTDQPQHAAATPTP